jgi:hypothetical protein
MSRSVKLALVAMAAAGLSGCESGSSSGPPAIDFEAPDAPSGEGFVALYAPPIDVGPYPNDIYNRPGETLSVPDKITSPLASALNTLDGFSTTAKISAPFNAPLDPASVVPFDPTIAPSGTESVFVLDATNGVPLVPGVDYSVGLATAAGTAGAILEFEPLVPLAADTTYAFILTERLASSAGVTAGPDLVFGTVRDAHLAGAMTGNPGLDALLPAIGPLIDAAVGLGIPAESIISAWSVTTQSISDVFESLDQEATARAVALTATGIDTSDLGLGLPGIADLYVGFIEIPYYGDPDDPLGSVWVNASREPPTRSDPVPIAQGGLQRIPLLVSLPNAGSGRSKPADGWPIVIFQHGVTTNRTIMVAIADGFAQAGFAIAAIDLPLHGVTDINSPFYQAPGNPFGTTERHFDLDNVGDIGEFEPDGAIDNGWQIFNVQNPLNARDHARQTVSDLIHLIRTAPTLDFDGDAAADVDAAGIHVVTVSLGSIFSLPLVAINDEFSTVTMTSPGGPYMDFLTNPEAIVFGLPIRQGIEAQGLAFGSIGYANFVRDLQTVLDPVDPVNYAAAAASSNHPLHVIEILGDTAVPAGLTENLAELMSLTDVSTMTADPGGVRGIVRFTAGGHSSLFNPAIDPAVTEEMQVQTVTFAASGGTVISVDNTDVVQ